MSEERDPFEPRTVEVRMNVHTLSGLQSAAKLTGMSESAVVNRAIQLYNKLIEALDQAGPGAAVYVEGKRGDPCMRWRDIGQKGAKR